MLTVWLRRQELEVRKVAVIAYSGTEDLKNLSQAYKEYVDTAFPFAATSRGASEQQLINEMRKEAEKGPIAFSVIQQPSPLQKTAARLRLPDDFKQKLKDRKEKRSA